MHFTTLFVAFALMFQSPAQLPIREAAKSSVPGATIVIDGEFGDWNTTSASLTDPTDAPNAAVDFGEVRASHDARFVHLLIDFGRTINAQGLDGSGMILLDVDGDATTGRSEHGMDGVDVIVEMTPPNSKDSSKPGMGIGLRSTTYQPDPTEMNARKINIYDVGLIHAPTYAGRRMEFRIARGVELPGTPVLFEGKEFRAKVVFVDLAGVVGDVTDVFTHGLGERAKPQAAEEPKVDPLARAAGTDLRVMCWNVERGAIFKKTEPFARSLKALQPDVVLFEELTDKNSGEQVQAFLNSTLPLKDGQWRVTFGAAGGDLRCAVATRFAIRDCEQVKMIHSIERPDRTIRAVGAIIEKDGKRLLATAIHLKCCGRAGGPEDDARKNEVNSINQAIKAALASGGIDGVVIAGDYNLVGSRDPLEMLASGLDLDHSTLIPADAFQLDGLSNATWADPGQPFVPGRLDFMLFADSTMKAVRTFVYDSSDLSPRWQEVHGVQAGDTAGASDHLPVVTDFVWVRK